MKATNWHEGTGRATRLPREAPDTFLHRAATLRKRRKLADLTSDTDAVAMGESTVESVTWHQAASFNTTASLPVTAFNGMVAQRASLAAALPGAGTVAQALHAGDLNLMHGHESCMPSHLWRNVSLWYVSELPRPCASPRRLHPTPAACAVHVACMGPRSVLNMRVNRYLPRVAVLEPRVVCGTMSPQVSAQGPRRSSVLLPRLAHVRGGMTSGPVSFCQLSHDRPRTQSSRPSFTLSRALDRSLHRRNCRSRWWSGSSANPPVT